MVSEDLKVEMVVGKFPTTQTYYQALARFKDGEWFNAGQLSTDKNEVITASKQWTADERKIITLELPV